MNPETRDEEAGEAVRTDEIPVDEVQAEQEQARWRGSRNSDAVTLLMLFVVLLMGLPSRYVLGPLGGAGVPALVLGMGLLLWWAVHQIAYGRTAGRFGDPGRWLMGFFALAVLLSYVSSMVRPIDGLELNAADRGLLLLAGWAGVTYLSMDGIQTRDRLDRLLRTVVLMGGAMGALGLLQFVTGMPFTNYLKLPGLSESGGLDSIANRDGLLRPAATALHPIEFGVVLSLVLPLALHYGMTDTRRGRLARWWPVATIGFAVPISVSRSTLICTVVAFMFLLPTWSPKQRRIAYVTAVGLFGAVFAAIPGMANTLLSLFTGAGNDSSVLSRTGSYEIAGQFIERSPIIGRGFGTFLPAYRILDNQYLGLMIEMGAVGLLSLLLLQWGTVVIAVQTRRRSLDPVTRNLAQSLAASTAAASVGFAFFDAFSFPQVGGLLFLLIGVVTALRRLVTHGADEPAAPDWVYAGPDEVNLDEINQDEFDQDQFDQDAINQDESAAGRPPQRA